MALPNLKDNISTTLKEFKIEDFVVSSEVPEFTGVLNGIEDIIGALTGIIDFISGFKDAVFKVLDSILNIFDLNAFFDAAGLSALSSSIFGMVGETMGFGSISDREEIRGLFNSACTQYNSALQQEFGTPSINMQKFALSSILLAILCNGNSGAYSSLLHMSYGDNAKDVPVPSPQYLTPEGGFSDTPTTIINNLDDITEANVTNAYRLKERNRLNNTFSKIISPILLSSGKMANLDVLKDISSTGLQYSAIMSNDRLGIQAAHYMENGYKNTKTPSTTYDDVMDTFNSFDPTFNDHTTDRGTSKYNNLPMLKEISALKIQSNVVRPNLVNDIVASVLPTEFYKLV